MIKKFIVVIICFAAYSLQAQNGTASPYSYYGVGDLRKATTVENQMMGGISMYADSIHLSLNNPASYSKLRLTTYAGGISRNKVDLKSDSASESTSIVNLDYLAIGVPLAKRFGMGFGLAPYSSVGYNVLSETTNSASDDVTTNSFSGSGGLNKVFLSFGYEIIENLSIGATANFNFGTIESERRQTIGSTQLATIDRRESVIHGVDFNLAINYSQPINKNHTFYTSLRIDTQSNLVSKNTQTTGTSINLIERDVAGTELKIPTTTTIGLGYGKEKKWFVGAEYSMQQLGSFKNDFLGVNNLTYNDATKINVGGFYIPDYTSFTSYFKRITYRGGLRVENTGMVVAGEEINDFGITFGVGLPLERSITGVRNFSNINIGFEIGRRGTTKASLIQENYFKINVGLSLSDKWFQKRKID